MEFGASDEPGSLLFLPTWPSLVLRGTRSHLKSTQAVEIMQHFGLRITSLWYLVV